MNSQNTETKVIDGKDCLTIAGIKVIDEYAKMCHRANSLTMLAWHLQFFFFFFDNQSYIQLYYNLWCWFHLFKNYFNLPLIC